MGYFIDFCWLLRSRAGSEQSLHPRCAGRVLSWVPAKACPRALTRRLDTDFPKRSCRTKDRRCRGLTTPHILAISAEEFEHEFAPTNCRQETHREYRHDCCRGRPFSKFGKPPVRSGRGQAFAADGALG